MQGLCWHWQYFIVMMKLQMQPKEFPLIIRLFYKQEKLRTRANVFDMSFQSECEQKGESYWYSVTASVVTRIVENIEVSCLMGARGGMTGAPPCKSMV